MCVRGGTLQVLSARYSLMFIVTFTVWPLECLWIMCSPNDVTLENAINLKLKPLLMGSFLKVVKLNCLLQDEGGLYGECPKGPGFASYQTCPLCWNAGFRVGLLCLLVLFKIL